MINIYGMEASGKSTLALTVAAEINKAGGTVAYIDCEHEVDLRYAKVIGVAVDNKELFQLYQPETMEQGLVVALAAISAGVDLVVWDSVGAALPEAEHEKSEKEMEATAKIGALAKKWGDKLPILKGRAAKTGSILLGIAQMRHNIGVMGHGDKYTVQGGMAWKYYSALRIRLTNIQKDKVDVVQGLDNKTEKTTIGAVVKARLDKCKVSDQQNAEVLFYIRWGEGVDNLRTLLESAINHKIIKKSGSWLTWHSVDGTEVKLQGIEKFRDHFMKNPAHAATLKEQVFAAVFTNKTEASTDEDDEVFEGEDDEMSLEDELAELLED